VVYHVDALTLEKLSANVKQLLVHSLTCTELVDEPDIFLVLDLVQQHADRFLLLQALKT